MAGAAMELGEALIVNPNDREGIVTALEEALAMSDEEQAERLGRKCERLRSYDIERWARDFLAGLEAIKAFQRSMEARRLDRKMRGELITAYRKANRRLLLLDYDGTLMPFSARAERVAPDDEAMTLLRALAKDPKNQVVVLSGRARQQLDRWLGALDIGLVAEHGAWSRDACDEPWVALEEWRAEWKKQVRPILDLYVSRVPGSLVEEKDFSLAWHYRAAEPVMGVARATELQDALRRLTANLDAAVSPGSKVLEIRTNHI